MGYQESFIYANVDVDKIYEIFKKHNLRMEHDILASIICKTECIKGIMSIKGHHIRKGQKLLVIQGERFMQNKTQLFQQENGEKFCRKEQRIIRKCKIIDIDSLLYNVGHDKYDEYFKDIESFESEESTKGA